MENFDSLRSRLFEVMDGLKDGSVDPEKANMICKTAQVIVNTLETEVKVIEAVGARPSQFMVEKNINRIK